MKAKEITAVGMLVAFFAVFVACKAKESTYSIGIQNLTANMLENAQLLLKPNGHFSCGTLVPQQAKYDMDPPWPMPEEIIVQFTDSQSSTFYERKAKATWTKTFSGEITVQIVKTGADFVLNCRAEPGRK